MALIFAAFWSLKTAHVLFWHHAHHNAPVCEAAHDERASHLHDERYNPDDCSICAFICAIPEIQPVSVQLPTLRVFTNALPVHLLVSCTPADVSHTCLRGPPAQRA